MITNPSADDTAPVTNPHLAALDRSFAALPSDTQDIVARAHQILGLQPPQTAGAVESAAAPAPVAPSVPNAQESASQTGPRITNPTLNPFRSAGMVAGNSDQAGALLASDRPPVSLPVQGSVGDGGDIADPGDDLPSSPSPLRIPSTNMSPAQGPTPAAQKLATLESSPSGLTGAVNGIHNPVLRGLGRVGATVADVIASGIVPRFGAFVPGSTAHHNLLVNQAQVPVRNEQAAAKNEADVAHTGAQTELENAQADEQRTLPELHRTQAELAAEKLSSANTAKDADRAIKQADQERKQGQGQQTIAAGLAEHGLKIDPDTKQVIPLPYGEMSQTQQAAHDLKGAQSELLSARKELVTAQKDGIPAAQELARRRVAAAQESAATAAGRLGLSRDEFNAQFLGTAPGGAPLAGGETDESGHPIGTKIAAANKPGATVQGRSAQAGSIIEAGENLKAEIDKHRDKLGNLGSYWNQAANGTPIADPDTARLMSEIASYAALQPAMHGMRGGQVMKEFEKMVGGVPKNPDALKAAIDGIASTASVMQHQGQHVSPQNSHVSPVKIANEGDYGKLAKGTVYIDPDGKQRTKQ